MSRIVKTETEANWQEIVKLLEQRPMRRADIFDQADCIESLKQLANLLYMRKKAGRVIQLDDGRYALPGTANRNKKETQEPATPPPSTPTPPAPKTSRTDPIEKFLIESLASAENALESYLESVGDCELVKQLTYARDYAKSALETYRKAVS